MQTKAIGTLLQLRARNVADGETPMYEGRNSALMTWIIGFPLLLTVLQSDLDLMLESSAKIASWAIEVLGLGD